VYARQAGDKELTFDFAEGLLRDNLVFVDRETNSVWSQLHGGAVSGPLTGTPLRALPSVQATWKFWRQTHPDTRVLIVKGEKGRPYLYRNRKPGTPPPEKAPTRHDTSALGLGLVVGGEAMFFPFRELDRVSTPLKLTLGREQVTVHYRKAALTAWAEDAEGRLLTGVLVYRDGWRAFFPKTRTYRASSRR
jgi:hypothetical protein